MTTPNEPVTGTTMVLTPRQEKLLAVRDEIAPGFKPTAIVPRTFLEAQQMCESLSRSGLVPSVYSSHPENMIVTIMSGAEVGLPPMQAIRLYHVMDNVPRLSAEGVRAIIVASPMCEYLEPQSMSETACTWIGKRAGRPEKSATWTIERAKKAGLTERKNRDGSPGNWIKYPEDMMNARASMQLGRLIWPEICAGMISREEAVDGDFIDVHATETKSPAFVQVPMTVVERAPPNDKPADPAPRRQRRVDPTSSSPAPSPAETQPPQSASSGNSAPSVSPSEGASKLEAAIQAVRDQDAARISKDSWGQPIAPAEPEPRPTGPSSDEAPSPSGGSAETSSSENGATPAGAGADDDGFGSAAAPAPAADTLNVKLVPFYAWLASCNTQRECQAGLAQWRAWSATQAKPVAEGGKADPDFLKASPGVPEGRGTIAMQTAYAKRKTEVPA